MPYTLAHPAAILPLRRFCPRYLSVAGLIVGSIVPDVGYAFARYHMDDLGHSFPGSFLFCLPVGAVMLFFMYAFRERVVNLLPERQRRLFLPLCRQPPGSPLKIAISILIGAWTHQLWDACTHPRGRITLHFPILQMQIGYVFNHTIEVCHLLLYGSTFAGVLWVCLAYGKWRKTADPSMPAADRKKGYWGSALLVASVTMPIEAVHHILETPFGLALVGFFSLILVIVIALKFGDYHPAAQIGRP